MARVVGENEAKKERPEPPEVRGRSRGRVNRAMDRPVEELREANPDKEYRWVYAPQQGSQYSQVTAREVQGYRVVDLSEEDIDIPDSMSPEGGSEFRVGDVVLMEIDKELQKQEEERRERRAEQEAQRSQEAYYQSLEEETGGHAAPTGEVETRKTTREVG